MNYTSTNTILDKIVWRTKEDLLRQKREVSLRDLESFENYDRSRRGFEQSIRKNKDQESDIPNKISIIAEVKKASPSKGVIRSDFDPLDTAKKYEKAGAAALSVLTDKPFFQGDLRYLNDISSITSIPLLRKDFIIDPYQVKEARAYGADAVLIIVAITNGSQLKELLHAAKEFELDALVECYSRTEVEELDWSQVEILGVNNRDLHTFEVDVHRGVNLLQMAPESKVKVSESGLSTPGDLKFLVQNGIDSALIGEHFMRQKDPGDALKRINQY